MKTFSLVKAIPSTLLALLVISLAGCQPNTKKQPNQTPAAPKTANAASETPLSIAVVDLDSLYANYQYYKDLNAKLEKKASANRATLENKSKALQQGMAAFQEKLQRGGFVSETAAAQEQERLIKMEQDARLLEQRLTESFIKESADANEELFATVKEEIKKFNTPQKYQYILTSMGIQNILYYNEASDITIEITQYLNDAYQKSKKATSNSDKKN